MKVEREVSNSKFFEKDECSKPRERVLIQTKQIFLSSFVGELRRRKFRQRRVCARQVDCASKFTDVATEMPTFAGFDVSLSDCNAQQWFRQ
jgi:hypothetical protein